MTLKTWPSLISLSFFTQVSDNKIPWLVSLAVLFRARPCRRGCLALKLIVLLSGNSREGRNDILHSLLQNCVSCPQSTCVNELDSQNFVYFRSKRHYYQNVYQSECISWYTCSNFWPCFQQKVIHSWLFFAMYCNRCVCFFSKNQFIQ